MRQIIKRIPVIGPIIRNVYRKFKPIKPFLNSTSYWEDRYKTGGNSGQGSYGKLALFKAEIINDFVEKNEIKEIIEHGCGDGHQLGLAQYESYIGFDVSPTIIDKCKKIFQKDGSKIFKTYDEYKNESAELSLSLDVIFHLVEDDTYQTYMKRLFDSSEIFLIIYSSNSEREPIQHERHRKFTIFVEMNYPQWKLIDHIPNKYPYSGDLTKGSFSDFFIYEKS